MSSKLMQISSMTVHRFKGNKPVNNGRSKPLRNHPRNHKRGASSCQFMPEIMLYCIIMETVSRARGCQRITTYLKPPASTSLSLSLPSKHWTKSCTGLAQKQIHHSPPRLDGKQLGKGKANPIVNTNSYCFLQKKILWWILYPKTSICAAVYPPTKRVNYIPSGNQTKMTWQ